MGETDFNQFMRVRNQVVIEVEHCGREENFLPVMIPLLANDKDEQIKQSHKELADVVDWTNRKICVTLQWYNVDTPESSNAQIRFFARKMEHKKFHQTVPLKQNFQEMIYLVDVLISVYDKVIINKPNCIVL